MFVSLSYYVLCFYIQTFIALLLIFFFFYKISLLILNTREVHHTIRLIGASIYNRYKSYYVEKLFVLFYPFIIIFFYKVYPYIY